MAVPPPNTANARPGNGLRLIAKGLVARPSLVCSSFRVTKESNLLKKDSFKPVGPRFLRDEESFKKLAPSPSPLGPACELILFLPFRPAFRNVPSRVTRNQNLRSAPKRWLPRRDCSDGGSAGAPRFQVPNESVRQSRWQTEDLPTDQRRVLSLSQPPPTSMLPPDARVDWITIVAKSAIV